jgi:hypothetical protein
MVVHAVPSLPNVGLRGRRPRVKMVLASVGARRAGRHRSRTCHAAPR